GRGRQAGEGGVRGGGEGEQRPRAEQVADPSGESPEQAAYLSELQATLSRAMASLDPRDALVLYLVYFEDLSLREISELIRVSERLLSRAHVAALLRLKSELGELVGDRAA